MKRPASSSLKEQRPNGSSEEEEEEEEKVYEEDVPGNQRVLQHVWSAAWRSAR